MWYSGSGISAVSAPSRRSRATQVDSCTTLAITWPWRSTAPLGTPVVPPVYCRKAMSPAPTGASSRGCAAPCSIASSSATACAMCQGGTSRRRWRTTTCVTSSRIGGIRSPTPVTTTASARPGWRASTACSVCAKFSSTTMARAPLSSSWRSSSSAVYCGLTLTTTPPARSTPNIATGCCSRLGSISATRSPGCRPWAWRSQAAKPALRRSSSLQLSEMSKLVTAARARWRDTPSRSRSHSVPTPAASICAGMPGG